MFSYEIDHTSIVNDHKFYIHSVHCREDHDKLEEQKKWLDSEVEKIVQQKREVEHLQEVQGFILHKYYAPTGNSKLQNVLKRSLLSMRNVIKWDEAWDNLGKMHAKHSRM